MKIHGVFYSPLPIFFNAAHLKPDVTNVFHLFFALQVSKKIKILIFQLIN